ncbi:hypothetical protein BDV93DRAFT_528196 [Ceratobasidium sp. AG-I]|nr:hypothetical protein BDV93DRAFT_528196 [Ceratobasidium sp. AG-I]
MPPRGDRHAKPHPLIIAGKRCASSSFGSHTSSASNDLPPEHSRRFHVEISVDPCIHTM